MAAFKSVLNRSQASAIRDYVGSRAEQGGTQPEVAAAHKPDPARGAVIVAQGTSSGAPACAQCHAFTGSSDGTGAFPRIAGQPAIYLSKQLHDFASRG